MTRINLVPPEELMDQHLFAEFREIKMVPKSLRRSIEAAQRRHLLTTDAVRSVLKRIPPRFTLNTGHVSFFYDKGAYLRERYELLKQELERRGYNFDRHAPLDPDGTMACAPWNRHYNPDADAFKIIRQRIAEKIQLKPHFYRYEGKPII